MIRYTLFVGFLTARKGSDGYGHLRSYSNMHHACHNTEQGTEDSKVVDQGERGTIDDERDKQRVKVEVEKDGETGNEEDVTRGDENERCEREENTGKDAEETG